jgi:anti-sigma regulatory factor (Ser/Thr protein kinase)
MGFECGTDSPPHIRITDSRRTLPRRDAMTSPINVGAPSGVPTSLGGPPSGVSGTVWAYPPPGRPWEERRPGCTGGDDERQLQEAGHTPAAPLGMTETADTQRVQIQLPDLEITLPARAENVAVVRHAVGGLGEVLEVDDQTLSDIKLAVTEACTNVVVHAYPDAEGPMGLRASIDGRNLSLVVTDRGRGIVPRPDSPGLGLGLPLIATLAESLELGTGRSEETEVRMTFDLGAPVSDDGAIA